MTDSSAPASYLPPASPPTNHGHTVAAWFTTIVVVVGSVLAGIAMCVSAMWLVWVGAAIVVVGLIGGKVLSVAGYGQPGAGGR